jgi:DNA-binding response OmpR family regulator
MHKLRILVAEDDPLIAMFIGEVLTEMGHEVCATEFTETDTVLAAERCNPDLMIVDAGLRNGSGVSAVEKILERAFVPHLFISGDRALLRALPGGAVGIEKPFQETQLVRAMALAMAAGPGVRARV